MFKRRLTTPLVLQSHSVYLIFSTREGCHLGAHLCCSPNAAEPYGQNSDNVFHFLTSIIITGATLARMEVKPSAAYLMQR